MGNLGSQEIIIILVVLLVIILVVLGIFLIIRYGVKNNRLNHRVTELERKLHERDQH